MKTRDKILESAKMLFLKHGLEGVKMQMVADEAGVNKGLLHYYYKTKAKIFTEVFSRVTGELFKDVKSLFEDETMTTDEKISKIVDAYFMLISKNKFLPVFFISEMNRNPEILITLGFADKVKALMEGATPIIPEGKPPGFAVHFILTLISLSAFPFMVSPLIDEITQDKKKTDEILLSRKEFVKDTLKNMLK